MTETKTGLGVSYKRKEDPRLLTGYGRFTDDIELKGMLHLAILRSPHAHAYIRNIDTSQAQKLPGVVAVLTGEESLKYTGRLATTIDIFNKVPEVYPIAHRKVRFVGEAVAVVAAVDRYIAEDAVDLIQVDYEPLPAVVTIEDALKPAALLYEEWGDNIQQDWKSTIGDIEEAFKNSAYVFEETITHSRYTGTPIESRVCIADYNPGSRKLTVTCSTQAPHQVRTLIAQTLKMPEHHIRVIAPDVGAGYGTKLQADAEIIVCIMARKLGKPVKWTEDRVENMLSGMQSRDYSCTIKIGLDQDYRITGLQAKLLANIGMDGTCHGPGTPALLVAGSYFPGAYKIPVYDVEVLGVVSNKGPYGAHRGYGKDIASYPVERMMDMVAQCLKISPIELRNRNFITKDEYPYRNIAGPIYDSGDFDQLMRLALEKAGYDRLKERQKELRKQGKYIGIGISAMLEPSGAAVFNGIFNGFQAATVRMTPEGGFQILTSHQNIGQGVETTLPQIVSDIMKVDIDHITFLYGDTDVTPYGLGPFSSRGATFTVSAVHEAAKLLRDKLIKIAGHLLRIDPSELEMDNGFIRKRGSSAQEESIRLKDLGNKIHLWPGPYGTIPEGLDVNLECTYTWTSPSVTWEPDENGRVNLYTTHPTGVFIAVVEVDVQTGQIKIEKFVVSHDCGTIINPMIINGQIAGGIAHGIGGALMEDLAYDSSGSLVNLDFQTYLCPTAMEVPVIESHHIQCPSPFTPLGTKGMGEGGAIPSPAAVANAVEDALEPFGVRVKNLPLSPEKVLQWIKRGERNAYAKS
ncbi:xanthine dehydrogenase family protein molybdopterin-binding subunit [Paenibacillus naphthalenovorans]|uniref:xanthine dehydrogenase family protein molybdopterin-binding subunit n=1 Tax=Paenibacillus naphthalenovorans TaxID=162209 RepID=UPI00087F0D9E|nr:xanthine dehydrogenase family protein molybdopterin-binding subunit [Paenibacillus naphthalenovorans]GCL71841.1 xanthine dehydrogenase family protein molybdopterin-binding subunit [Paenibacillus naphthalenovorans]SDI40277.1 carbon-monoxide dehydrogenase large subunit [Paenibacillus naphthalenovorans]